MNEYLQGIDDDKSRGGPYEVRGADALLFRPCIRGSDHNGADVSCSECILLSGYVLIVGSSAYLPQYNYCSPRRVSKLRSRSTARYMERISPLVAQVPAQLTPQLLVGLPSRLYRGQISLIFRHVEPTGLFPVSTVARFTSIPNYLESVPPRYVDKRV